jgi:hypothetical protein
MPVPGVPEARSYAELGARFFCVTGDYSLLRNGFIRAREEFDLAFGS